MHRDRMHWFVAGSCGLLCLIGILVLSGLAYKAFVKPDLDFDNGQHRVYPVVSDHELSPGLSIVDFKSEDEHIKVFVYKDLKGDVSICTVDK